MLLHAGNDDAVATENYEQKLIANLITMNDEVTKLFRTIKTNMCIIHQLVIGRDSLFPLTEKRPVTQP